MKISLVIEKERIQWRMGQGLTVTEGHILNGSVDLKCLDKADH